MKLNSGIVELKPGWFVRLPYPMTVMEMARYRFDPITIAAIAGVGLMAGGQIQQGRAADAEAKSAANMAEYNAKVQEREARAIEQKARFDQMRQLQAGERVKNSLLSKLGASGADISAGAPLSLQAEQASELELENLLIGYEGQLGSQRAMSQAAMDRMQAKIYKQKGKSAKQASYMKAGTTLLTGFGSMDTGTEAGGGGNPNFMNKMII